MKKRYVVLVIIIILLCLFVGVLYVFPTKKHYEDIVIYNEQRIRVQIENSPRTLDPQKAYLPEDLMLICNLQEGLFGISENGEYIFGEGLGESYEVESNGLVYRFYLRDANWSDGKPITSTDFYQGWKRALDLKEESPYGYLLYNIKNAQKYINEEVGEAELGITILSSSAFEVELEEKDPNFLDKLVHPVFFPITFESADINASEFNKYDSSYISSGPFVIEEWIPYNKITFSKNPRYWDTDNVIIENIDFLVVNEDIRIFEAFRAGELDTIEVSENYRINIKNSPGFYFIEEKESDIPEEIKEFERNSGQIEKKLRIGVIRPHIKRLFVLHYPIKYHFKWSYVNY